MAIRKAELRDRLLAEGSWTTSERDQFAQFCQLLEAAIHYDYHHLLETLKDAYAPFDPDRETRSLATTPKADALQHSADDFFDALADLVDRANFQHLLHDDLAESLNRASALGLNLTVDLSVFQRLEIFARGSATITKRLPWTWTRWASRPIELPIYRRLILAFRLQKHKRLGGEVDTDTIYVKIFKDIPKADVDMLLPGSQVRMSLLDRGKVALPTLSGLAIAAHKIVTTTAIFALSGIYGILAVLGLVGGTLGYGIRSFFAYLNAKDKYQLNLTRSLYFQNLDNNAGVLFRLLDEAEEQEFREAVLAYYLLLKHADAEGWTSEQLDAAAERYLTELLGTTIDFEIDDALGKLAAMKLATNTAGRWRAKSLDDALAQLDATWDGLFTAGKARTRQHAPHFFRGAKSDPPLDSNDWGPIL